MLKINMKNESFFMNVRVSEIYTLEINFPQIALETNATTVSRRFLI